MRQWSDRLRELLPSASVPIAQDVDRDAVWLPSREAARDGFTDNRDYVALGPVSWAHVRDIAELETEVLEATAVGSLDYDAFEDRLADLEYENVPVWDLESLELGVASAVLALNAVGCVTTFSCRGHGPAEYPQIRFGAELVMLDELVQVAELSGCGMSSDDEGLLWLYAPSVLQMCAFADALLRSATPPED